MVHYTGSAPSNVNSGWTVTGDGSFIPVFSLAGSAGNAYLDVMFTTTPANSIWISGSNGSWSNPANWANDTVPMYPVDTATFGIPQPSGTIAVSLDGNYTVERMTFSNTGGGLYDITPGTGGVLTLANTGTAGAPSDHDGGRVKSTPLS